MLNMMWSGGYLLPRSSACSARCGLSASYLKIGAIGTGGDLGLGAALQQALTRLPVVIVMMIMFDVRVLLGFILLVIPCLILMVSLALCFNLALLENKGPIDALTESHRLVWVTGGARRRSSPSASSSSS